MNSILEKIVEYKKVEVEERESIRPVKDLSKMDSFDIPRVSLCDYLLDDVSTGIIAEFKRKSPSKGIINDRVNVADVACAYQEFGASGISILTDGPSFGGSLDDLAIVRDKVQIPVLRKEFIVSKYQLVEARAYGADVILLIAACLTPNETFRLAQYAWELGLEVLLEVHNQEELAHINEYVNIVGVNNRDLNDFSVDVNRSLELGSLIDEEYIKISESGIGEVNQIKMLREAGFQGFLIGESFMKQPDPGLAFKLFTESIRDLK